MCSTVCQERFLPTTVVQEPGLDTCRTPAADLTQASSEFGSVVLPDLLCPACSSPDGVVDMSARQSLIGSVRQISQPRASCGQSDESR